MLNHGEMDRDFQVKVTVRTLEVTYQQSFISKIIFITQRSEKNHLDLYQPICHLGTVLGSDLSLNIIDLDVIKYCYKYLTWYWYLYQVP